MDGIPISFAKAALSFLLQKAVAAWVRKKQQILKWEVGEAYLVRLLCGKGEALRRKRNF
jgi:hypothetical protein